jgi:hypothetical protein
VKPGVIDAVHCLEHLVIVTAQGPEAEKAGIVLGLGDEHFTAVRVNDHSANVHFPPDIKCVEKHDTPHFE